jgi:hypothetical protein
MDFIRTRLKLRRHGAIPAAYGCFDSLPIVRDVRNFNLSAPLFILKYLAYAADPSGFDSIT